MLFRGNSNLENTQYFVNLHFIVVECIKAFVRREPKQNAFCIIAIEDCYCFMVFEKVVEKPLPHQLPMPCYAYHRHLCCKVFPIIGQFTGYPFNKNTPCFVHIISNLSWFMQYPPSNTFLFCSISSNTIFLQFFNYCWPL